MSTKPPRLSEYEDRSVFRLAVIFVILLLIGLLSFGASSRADAELVVPIYAAVVSLLLLLKMLAYLVALRPTSQHINAHVGWLYAAGLPTALYFGVALANVIAQAMRSFGGRVDILDTILVYGQIFGPNWYEFGWPDMFAAAALAVVLDVIVLQFFPLPSRRLPQLIIIAAMANLLVYGITTITFLFWLRTPFFS